MTPLVQHFNTSDGAYAPTVQATADQLSPGAFPCVPLQQSPSPATSPNSWRAADLLQASAPFNASITVIPFHALTARLHQFHPGNVAKTHERKTSVDCSHLRYTPWLYEPVWSAILVSIHGRHPWIAAASEAEPPQLHSTIIYQRWYIRIHMQDGRHTN